MSKKIPHSRPTLGSNEAGAVYALIKSGNLAQGEKVREFEKQFARFQKTKWSAATSSGTAALHLALRALKIKNNDEVIIPSYVCTALLNAVHYVGARAKIVDVDDDDFNISVRGVKKNISRRTKAIIVPHIFGQPADLSPLMALGIPLIEDCAHSLGATYQRRQAGSFGALSIYSFYATKMMTTGEGGMVTSNHQRLINQIKDWRDYDHKPSYQVRFNYKMTDLQAAMGIVQLSRLPSWIKRRKEIAARYQKNLRQCDFDLPVRKSDRSHVFYRFVIKVKKNKAQLMKALKRKGIDCAEPIYKPLHQYLNLKGYPVTDRLVQEAVSIPIYPSLIDRQCAYIIKCIKMVSE